MHCHCHELDRKELKKYVDQGMVLVCVSDDPASSIETIKLKQEYSEIMPCIGIHPWEIHSYTGDQVDQVLALIKDHNIKCLGEIGLDKRFYPQTYEYQKRLFIKFLETAREYDLVLNLHTAGAWKEVFEYLLRYDIKRAFFHWYTGPQYLLREFINVGYFIGINPAWKIQEKHKKIIEKASLDIMITESDAPYRYRKLELKPSMVFESIEYIAGVKNVKREVVIQTIWNNFNKLFS